MAKRTEQATRGETGSTGDSMEKRMLAFAEQIGRIAGTVQAKAEGWMDRDTLNAQITSIRDSATDLLHHIAGKKPPTPGANAGQTRGAANRSTSGARPMKTARPKATAAATPKRGGGTKAAPAEKMRAADGGKKPTKMGAAATSGSTATEKGAGRGRSGGAVDAPGKKHRGPVPSESGATGAPRGQGSRLAKLKAANMNRIQRRG
jgi:hypothetical protein